ISLARWLLYPAPLALLLLVFIVGLFAGAFGYALHISFALLAGYYGLLLVALLLTAPLAGSRNAAGQVAGLVVLAAVASGLVWLATQNAQAVVMVALMFGVMAGFSGLALISNGESRSQPPDTSRLKHLLASGSLVCLTLLALWFLGGLALLALFVL